jgi:hypothetical protein
MVRIGCQTTALHRRGLWGGSYVTSNFNLFPKLEEVWRVRVPIAWHYGT